MAVLRVRVGAQPAGMGFGFPALPDRPVLLRPGEGFLVDRGDVEQVAVDAEFLIEHAGEVVRATVVVGDAGTRAVRVIPDHAQGFVGHRAIGEWKRWA
ncbi:hypothetical protein D3C71_2008680 [compost metagenome]